MSKRAVPPSKVEHVMCVDPGLSGTGWSFWIKDENVNANEPRNSWRIAMSGAFTPSGEALQDRVADLARVLHGLLVTMTAATKATRVVLAVEHPQYFQGAGATNASGALVSLAMAAGAALSASALHPCCRPLLVPLSWKGNLPKEICCARIVERMRRDPACRNWEPRTKTTHEIDAVGIGLYLQGRF